MLYFLEGNKLPEFYGVAEVSQDHGTGVNEKLQFTGFSNYFSYIPSLTLAFPCFLTVPLPTLQFQSCLGGTGIFLIFVMSP